MQTVFSFDVNQRWFHGRTNFRLACEPMNPSEFGVEPLAREAAIDFVRTHHYSRSCCPQIQSFGLYRKTSAHVAARLVGVAVFSQGSNYQDRKDSAGNVIERKNSITAWTGLDYDAGAELGRFILLDECAGNTESYFLARAKAQFKAMRPEKKVVLSYSDPCPRTSITGEKILIGHWGAVYAATNSIYMGRNKPKTQILDAAGREVSRRAIQKFISEESGADYALADLEERSGLIWAEGESREAFIDRAVSAMRVRRHPGNHLFVFVLGADRREKRQIESLPKLVAARNALITGERPYPKRPDAEPEWRKAA